MEDRALEQSARVETARRRADLVAAGRSGDASSVVASRNDADASIRAGVLRASAAAKLLSAADLWSWSRDPAPAVRSTLCELASRLLQSFELVDVLGAIALCLLEDRDAAVVETAAFALGEVGDPAACERLSEIARSHPDSLCRESAVAALGAIGDPRGLEAVLAAFDDRPAVRRRAVLALAAFEGDDVDAALEAARTDRDWQVRQAAEDLLDRPPPD